MLHADCTKQINKQNALIILEHSNYLDFQLVVSPSCCQCAEWQPAPQSLLGGLSCWGPPESSSGAPAHSLPPRFWGRRLQLHSFLDLFSTVSAQCEQCSADPGHNSVWEQGKKKKKEMSNMKCEIEFNLSSVVEGKRKWHVTDQLRRSFGHSSYTLHMVDKQHWTGARNRNLGIRETQQNADVIFKRT